MSSTRQTGFRVDTVRLAGMLVASLFLVLMTFAIGKYILKAKTQAEAPTKVLATLNRAKDNQISYIPIYWSGKKLVMISDTKTIRLLELPNMEVFKTIEIEMSDSPPIPRVQIGDDKLFILYYDTRQGWTIIQLSADSLNIEYKLFGGSSLDSVNSLYTFNSRKDWLLSEPRDPYAHQLIVTRNGIEGLVPVFVNPRERHHYHGPDDIWWEYIWFRINNGKVIYGPITGAYGSDLKYSILPQGSGSMPGLIWNEGRGGLVYQEIKYRNNSVETGRTLTYDFNLNRDNYIDTFIVLPSSEDRPSEDFELLVHIISGLNSSSDSQAKGYWTLAKFSRRTFTLLSSEETRIPDDFVTSLNGREVMRRMDSQVFLLGMGGRSTKIPELLMLQLSSPDAPRVSIVASYKEARWPGVVLNISDTDPGHVMFYVFSDETLTILEYESP